MNPTEAALKILGSEGSQIVTDTTRVSGKWSKMYILTAAQLDEYTDASCRNSSALCGFSLAAGLTIAGQIEVVKLSSGRVILYD